MLNFWAVVRAPARNNAALQGYGLVASKVTPVGSFAVSEPGTTGAVNTVSGAALDSFVQSDTNRLVTLIILRRQPETFFNQSPIDGVVHRFAPKERAGELAAPSPSAVPAAVPVPEPSSMLMVGLAAVSLGAGLRRPKGPVA